MKPAATMTKRTNISSWTVIGVLAVVFAFTGITKLIGLSMHTENFARWGYPAWFVYVAGVGETIAAAMLLWRPTSGIAAAGLTMIMAGAVFTHVQAGESNAIALPGVLLVGALIVVRVRPDTIMDAVHWAEHPHMPHRQH